jgi:hypothetical protein
MIVSNGRLIDYDKALIKITVNTLVFTTVVNQ